MTDWGVATRTGNSGNDVVGICDYIMQCRLLLDLHPLWVFCHCSSRTKAVSALTSTADSKHGATANNIKDWACLRCDLSSCHQKPDHPCPIPLDQLRPPSENSTAPSWTKPARHCSAKKTQQHKQVCKVSLASHRLNGSEGPWLVLYWTSFCLKCPSFCLRLHICQENGSI